MPQFKPGQPVETTTSDVEVTVTPTAPLPAGRHRLQLIVEDDSANVSDPSIAEVIVRDTQSRPTVLDAPSQVELGRSFQLSGKRSSDVASAKIVKFIWTRLD